MEKTEYERMVFDAAMRLYCEHKVGVDEAARRMLELARGLGIAKEDDREDEAAREMLRAMHGDLAGLVFPSDTPQETVDRLNNAARNIRLFLEDG